MTNVTPAPLTMWLSHPLEPDVIQSVDRLRLSDDVRHVALMPDIHLANDVCIGAVVATERLIYPAAVGGDIGCGMIALAFETDASVIDNERAAARILAGLYEFVPSNKHAKAKELPASLTHVELSDGRLQKIAARDGRVQLGTLGRGNHFLEFQADQERRLWVMIHSGSRAVGQAVTDHHLGSASSAESGLKYLDMDEGDGQRYLADVHWARTYAAENRLAMLTAVVELVQRLFGIATDWDSLIHCDHNHMQRELHSGTTLWVHRKGAQSANSDEPGIIPGSMGTASFHTLGRGCADALMSCSHGAGRALSRSEARRAVNKKDFARQVGKLWYDHRQATKFRDEAPAAYKDIRQVMKVQRELTRIVRELRPLLTYKGV
jgi:tRNA-splicing ligase RtcB (3'-phosphate/5'-hydroxy nucleic acid ligase)